MKTSNLINWLINHWTVWPSALRRGKVKCWRNCAKIHRSAHNEIYDSELEEEKEELTTTMFPFDFVTFRPFIARCDCERSRSSLTHIFLYSDLFFSVGGSRPDIFRKKSICVCLVAVNFCRLHEFDRKSLRSDYSASVWLVCGWIVDGKCRDLICENSLSCFRKKAIKRHWFRWVDVMLSRCLLAELFSDCSYSCQTN